MSEGSFHEKTKWHKLPNADHIDRILVSIKAHPEEWIAAWDAAFHAAFDAAKVAAWRAAYDAARDAARYAARDAAWDAGLTAASRMSARAAISTLITWDDSSKYLDMPSDQLRVWYTLSEDPACILLLPAVIAFEKINELQMA